MTRAFSNVSVKNQLLKSDNYNTDKVLCENNNDDEPKYIHKKFKKLATTIEYSKKIESDYCSDSGGPYLLGDNKICVENRKSGHICPYCNVSCLKPSVLQKHVRAHTNERPYPCVPCGFAFKTKSNLYKHRKSRAHVLRINKQITKNSPKNVKNLNLIYDESCRTACSSHSRIYKPKFHVNPEDSLNVTQRQISSPGPVLGNTRLVENGLQVDKREISSETRTVNALQFSGSKVRVLHKAGNLKSSSNNHLQYHEFHNNNLDRLCHKVKETTYFIPSNLSSEQLLLAPRASKAALLKLSVDTSVNLHQNSPSTLFLTSFTFATKTSSSPSPKTPRPMQSYGQLFLNGHAYTYLGLKCSTRLYFCTINRPQPMYVVQRNGLSMYSNWKICKEVISESELGLYDSRHRPSNYTLASSHQVDILTHSSSFKENSNSDKHNADNLENIICSKKYDSSEEISKVSEHLTFKDDSSKKFFFTRNGLYRVGCNDISKTAPSTHLKNLCSDLIKDVKTMCRNNFLIEANCANDLKSFNCKKMSRTTENFENSKVVDSAQQDAALSLLSLSRFVGEKIANRLSTKSLGLVSTARPQTYPYALRFKCKNPLSTEDFSSSSKCCFFHCDFKTKKDIADISCESDNSFKELKDNKEESKDHNQLEKLMQTNNLKKSSFYEFCHYVAPVNTSSSESSKKFPCEYSFIKVNCDETYLHRSCSDNSTNITEPLELSLSDKSRKTCNNDCLQNLHSEGNHQNSFNQGFEKKGKLLHTNKENYVINAEDEHFHIDNKFNDVGQPEISAEMCKNESFLKACDIEKLKSISMCPKQCLHNVIEPPKSTKNSLKLSDSVLEHNKSNLNELQNSRTVNEEESCQEKRNPDAKNANFKVRVPLKATNLSFKLGKGSLQGQQQKVNDILLSSMNSTLETADATVTKVYSKDCLNSNVATQSSIGYSSGRYASLSNDERSVCTICNKVFNKPSQLRLHINIHYFERPFRCESCAVSFRTKGHLTKHERSVSHQNKVSMTTTFGLATISNPRPFKCTDCKIAFRIHGHLAKHLRSKMHIMKLECEGKLPFGTFAELEKSGINFNQIDTTDCSNSLHSLQVLAKHIYESDAKTTMKVVKPKSNFQDISCGELSSDEETDVDCTSTNDPRNIAVPYVRSFDNSELELIMQNNKLFKCKICKVSLRNVKELQIHCLFNHSVNLDKNLNTSIFRNSEKGITKNNHNSSSSNEQNVGVS